MKITKSQLRQMIKEEISKGIDEGVMDSIKTAASDAGAAIAASPFGQKVAKAGRTVQGKLQRQLGDGSTEIRYTGKNHAKLRDALDKIRKWNFRNKDPITGTDDALGDYFSSELDLAWQAFDPKAKGGEYYGVLTMDDHSNINDEFNNRANALYDAGHDKSAAAKVLDAVGTFFVNLTGPAEEVPGSEGTRVAQFDDSAPEIRWIIKMADALPQGKK